MNRGRNGAVFVLASCSTSVTTFGLKLFTICSIRSRGLVVQTLSSGTWWSWSAKFTASASPCCRSSIHACTSGHFFSTAWNTKGTPTDWASFLRRLPTNLSPPGGVISEEGSSTPVIRKWGGPPGLAAKACIRVLHWTPWLISKSIMCTWSSFWNASAIAPLAAMYPNLK